MPKAIGYEEWLAEMERLGRESPSSSGLLTVNEIAEVRGETIGIVRDKLKRASCTGNLIVGRKRVTRIDGMSTLVPAYRIKKK